MSAFASIIVAGLTLIGTVTASIFAAKASASSQVDQQVTAVNTQVQVIKTTQDLQYKEVKESLLRIESRLDRALK